MTINAVSLNARGLNKSIKRRKLFRWLHIRKFDVIFLQETYSDASLENFWRAEWGGEIFFAHGSKHSRGVMILFRPSLSIEVTNVTADKNGRFIIVNTTVNEDELCLVNIYAPNDQNQQISFYQKITDSIRGHQIDKILIGGDFNCPLSASDKFGGKDIKFKKSVIHSIDELRRNYDLVDPWREQHPHDTQFTWRNSSGKIKCRLDFWLISKHLLCRVAHTDISAYHDSDHSPVTISIKPEDKQEKRGPGYWKFNNSLLENEDFVIKMSFIIKHAAQKHKDVADKRLFWEMLKMEIRIFAIRFAKKKANAERSKELNLLQKLEKINSRIDETPENSALVNKARKLKIELDEIAVQKTKGSIIRSRARWYELGEKCNKYFLNLEKRSYEKKHITKLKTPDGSTVEDPKIILTAMNNFYNQLYTSQNQLSDERFSTFFDCESLPKLDSTKQDLCEGLITTEECLAALKTFQPNKTPGTDGLTAEFYLRFWTDISGPLIDCLNHSALLGELSISQRQGIISLIPKKNKDPLLLKNWRPISLLNTDYKLATKCIAKRLEKVLPYLIDGDQTGYIKGRFIGENIRLISDIIEQHENKGGMILFLDFEKAFDSLEWDFLFKVLNTMNFGPSFLNWIKTFYTNISSCVVNNGYSSKFFSLQRGVRQGCPLSGLLFVLAVEPLAHQIRINESIKGLENGNKITKLSMYADDTTAFIRDDSSAVSLLTLLEQFGDLSGLKINKSKTEGLWLGPLKSRLGKEEPFGILWPKLYVIALGIAFPYHVQVGNKINFNEKLSKLKKVLNAWSSRHLTILGRIAIVKSLALAKLVYSCSVLNVPEEFVKEVNNNIFSFIWNFKPDKIKRKTLTGPVSHGGLNMLNFADVVKSLKTSWVNRYCRANDRHWCALLDSLLSKVGGTLLFQCNYDLKLLDLKSLSVFYKDVLAVWQELNSKDPRNANEYKQEIIWNNRFIKIDGKSFYYRSWANKGIMKISDLLNTHGQFLSFENFKCKYGVRSTFLDYAGVLAAIPKIWKSEIVGNFINGNNELVPSLDISSTKKARVMLAERSFSPPIVEINLRKQVLNVKAVYELPFKVTVENKLRSFQFKLIHNIIPTNHSLYKMNIKASPECERCLFPNETLIHMLCECPDVKIFWKDIMMWWNAKRSDNISPSNTEILYGYKPETATFYALNHYLLIAKYHVFLARNRSETPNLMVFLALLDSKIKCEEQIAIKNLNYKKYRAKWTTLSNCDT